MSIASYKDREAWLEARKLGIGGSDAGAILGLNPYKSAYDVWLDKTRRSAPSMITAAMMRGITLEPVAAELYAEKTGRQLRRQPLKKHPEYPFIIGNVDRQILAVGDVSSTGVLEIKCPGLRTMANIKNRGLPDYMVAQIMHYLAVYGYEWGSFALFNAENWDIFHFDIEADPKLIEQIVQAEVDFWKYVEKDTPPPTEPVEAIEMPEVEGALIYVDGEEWIKAAKDFQEARELREAAQALEDQAKSLIREMMDQHEYAAIEIPGMARFYYRTMSGRVSWKKTAEAIAAAAQLPLDEYKVIGKGYRQFAPFFIKPSEE